MNKPPRSDEVSENFSPSLSSSGGPAGLTMSSYGTTAFDPANYMAVDPLWKNMFLTEPPRLDLFQDHGRPLEPSYRRSSESLNLHSKDWLTLKQAIERQGFDAVSVAVASWLVLLSRTTEEVDLCIGFVPSIRNALFPFRVSLSGLTARNLIERVREYSLNIHSLPELDWQRMLGQVWKRISSVRPFPFQIAVNLDRKTSLEALPAGILRRMDAVFSAEHTEGGFVLRLDYDDELFSESGVQMRLSQVSRLCMSILESPDLPLSELSFLSSEDENAYRIVNHTDMVYPTEETIDSIFKRFAAESPSRTGLLYREESFSLARLDALSATLAERILNIIPFGPGVIGLHADRSPESIVGLLATLRAGKAYLPLDPTFPEERLRFMMEDSGAELLLSANPERPAFAGGCPMLSIDLSELERERPSGQERERSSSGANQAHTAFCIMYTSGSTGRPKGVINSHYATLNCFYWMWETYPFRPGEVCCQTSSLAFGDSIQEVLGPLLRSVPLILVPLEVLRNPRALLELLSEKRVTRITVVPSLLERLLDVTPNLAQALPYLRLWITSGETLPRALAERFLESHPEATLVNLYGASELSNDVTWHEVRKSSTRRNPRVRIGRPISNMRIYVVDSARRLVPVGIPGELWVSGRGVCPGYQLHPELTAERFVDNPFLGGEPNPDQKVCYRTGDQVCLRFDGELEFLGRVDSQVKIAGKRIELEEVETVLQEFPTVKRAVVVLRVSPFGLSQLVAYLQPDEKTEFQLREVVKHARSLLPDYMTPTAWQVLDKLPLTGSGKIDKRTLPEPAWTNIVGSFPSNLDTDQAVIADLWREVLEYSGPIGLEQNFFDLGGTSLAMMMLIVKLEKRFQIPLSSKSIFTSPSISGIAELIQSLK